MKKEAGFFLAMMCVMTLAGCGISGHAEKAEHPISQPVAGTGADSPIIDNAEQAGTGGVNAEKIIDTEEPSWAAGTQLEAPPALPGTRNTEYGFSLPFCSILKASR